MTETAPRSMQEPIVAAAAAAKHCRHQHPVLRLCSHDYMFVVSVRARIECEIGIPVLSTVCGHHIFFSPSFFSHPNNKKEQRNKIKKKKRKSPQVKPG